MSLQETYNKEIIPKLKQEFDLKNPFVFPKMTKAVINTGFGKYAKDEEYIKNVEEALAKIAGQKPIRTKAKKSVSGFKVREGMTIGASATLRGKRMYDFVEKLVGVTFPRVRDFRGINQSAVDASGNLTIGIKEHTAFPEISGEDIENVFGLEITIVTNIQDREKSMELFKLLGFPFKK